jgi:hypothetical protein
MSTNKAQILWKTEQCRLFATGACPRPVGMSLVSPVASMRDLLETQPFFIFCGVQESVPSPTVPKTFVKCP